MDILLENLKEQLIRENKHLEYLKSRMNDDISQNDFEHLCRLSAEANETKGKIEMLNTTIVHMKYRMKQASKRILLSVIN